jgi:hypothetical protein
LEHEIRGEPSAIALHGLDERLRRYAVDACEVGIEHDALAANNVNQPLDLLACGQRRHASPSSLALTQC